MCQQCFVASSSVLFAPKYKCLVLKERHPKKAKVRMFQVVLKSLKYYRACSLWGDENYVKVSIYYCEVMRIYTLL